MEASCPVSATGLLQDPCYQTARIASPETANNLLSEEIANVNKKMVEQNSKIVSSNSDEKFQVTTFNAGLLKTKVLGILQLEVPQYESRRPLVFSAIASHLREEKPFFFFLQEVWHRNDFDQIKEIAGSEGYVVIGTRGSNKFRPYGLVTLARKQGLKCTEAGCEISTGRSFEETIAGFKRGFLPTLLTTESGLRGLIVNSHFTYSPGKTETRLRQAKKIIDYIARVDDIDFVVFSADTNSSDTFANQAEIFNPPWFRDREVYLTIASELGFIDSYRTVNPRKPGFTQDPEKNTLTALSATTKNEPRQRLDYIFLAGRGAVEVGVVDSDLIFDSPSGSGNDSLFLSDHFGVTSSVVLRKNP